MNDNNICKLCGEKNSFRQVLDLENFPKSAQFMPAEHEFKLDFPLTLQVIECTRCGLVQLNNDPVDYYKDVITAASISEESRKILKNEFNPIIKKFNLQNKLTLEIGSGKGDFLKVLNELNVNAFGLEHKKESVQLSKEKGLNVIQGYLLDQIKISEKFAFIICNNFLEHQPDVKAFLNKVNDLLIEDGVIYISVPNLQRIIDKNCFYEFVTDHLVYFTQKSLKLALEMHGFDIIESYLKNNENDISVIAQKRKITTIKNKKHKMDEIVNSLSTLVLNNHKQGKKVSVWGAGHRALALMAIANVNQIDYVVDSAPFKQGRYTPILKKKIISPADFLKIECDLLILMLPGSYSEQVKNNLEKTGFNGKYIIFKDEVLV